jgi:fermentation-respiration switch protein FrsA (DUF1100 family)
MKKIIAWTMAGVLGLLFLAVIGGSFYMLDYSLAPDPTREDRDSCFRELYANYPETREWMDSLRRNEALRDTFLTMPSGKRGHAYFVNRGGERTAFVIHGWRDQAIKFFYLTQMYEREFGYNVIIPDLYASGKSDGDALRMGWLDRLDMLEWLQAFRTDTMVVHGVSMGAATTMMMSGEEMPEDIRDLRFVADCGYTSVWDEFAGELKNQFGLPAFPLMYTTSLLCKVLYGWSFEEASAIEAVKRCPYPMLFIHGDADDFVPVDHVYKNYAAKTHGYKELYIVPGAVHANSYAKDPKNYIWRVKYFLDRVKSGEIK